MDLQKFSHYTGNWVEKYPHAISYNDYKTQYTSDKVFHIKLFHIYTNH